MKFVIAITHVATGETRYHDDDFDWPSEDRFVFMWTEGNYSCDCNRELFFGRAGGEPDPPEDENECGNERYRAVAVREDGSTLVLDTLP